MSELEINEREEEFHLALIGNMNVGKTSIFSKICSTKVKSINLPGSTVAINGSSLKSQKGYVYDTPGILSHPRYLKK